MTPHKQVCTREQAARLQALGIKQEAMFYWYEANINGHTSFQLINYQNWEYGSIVVVNGLIDSALKKKSTNKCYAAFTISEMQLMDGSLGNIEKSEMNDKKGKFYSQTNFEEDTPHAGG